MKPPVHVTVQMATVGTPVEVCALQVILYSIAQLEPVYSMSITWCCFSVRSRLCKTKYRVIRFTLLIVRYITSVM